MNKNRAVRLLDDTFRSSFDIGQFSKFIKELFNDILINVQDKTPYIAKQFKGYISECKKIAEYEDASKKSMEILAVKLVRTSSRDRARTMQRNFVSSWLSKQDIDAALVAFYGEDDEDWRFSYVKMEYNLVKNEDGKVIVEKELTPAKRYSFLVGVNEPNHTCQRQLLDLVMDDRNNPSISEIEQAFNIEKVTKEFFEKYKELAINLREAMDKIVSNDARIEQEFENKGISTIDFSKKLLGQIVFLYFLQKKGWLGVRKKPDGTFEEWGTGPKNFLRKLFNKEIVAYDNFFNDILEPLFYEALAHDRSADNDYYSRFKCKIPFLNGGLFEPLNDYNWTGMDIIIPNELFSNSVRTKEGDNGTGILDVFDRYNFTVKEDEPLEKEVAVDPEMLGKVFENLLEVKERKDKGAFYTPREIVHYMCQQSLINYIETNMPDIPRVDIERFVQYGDIALNQTLRSLSEKEKYHGKSYVDEKLLVPQSIANNCQKIDKLLRDIKIVDPAVGSGAFPVGMMNEIVKARSILTVFFPKDEQESRTEYNLKRQCIENSLYGVDIDASAVEIAKLRFWLSLIVDEEKKEKIQPLPNLDHKIMCGNSLLEEFEGIKLFDERLLGEVETKSPTDVEIEGISERIIRLNSQLKNLGFVEQRSEIKKKLEELELLKQRKAKLEKRRVREKLQKERETQIQTTMDTVLQQRIKESQIKLKRLKELQKKYFNEQDRNKKKEFREEMDRIEWKLIEATLKEEKHENALAKLEQYRKTKVKPFFLWKLYFAEVFQRENPGFDVVIGNPPYIQLQNKEKIKPEMQEAYGKTGYQTFTKRGDIYCLFYERGYLVLRESGTLTFITSNKWMRADYGRKLREYFLNNVLIEQLIDFGDSPIFEGATTYTNILIFSKKKTEMPPGVWDLSSIYRMNHSLAEMLLKYGQGEAEFTADSFIILSKKEAGIKEKIEKLGTPLKDWDIDINYGIKTGYNEAFIIDGKTKDKLIVQDPKSAEIIKPILRGRDIKRYAVEFMDKWAINTHNGYRGESGRYMSPIDINKYPAIKDYLDKYWDKLKKRQDKGVTPYNLRNCAYLEEFEKEKIIYAEIVFDSAFYYDTNGYYPEATAFIMTGEGLKYLTALLNSRLLTYAFKRYYAGGDLRGNTFRYKKVFLKNLPVPKIPPDQQAPFISLVDQILAITKDDDYLANPEKQARVKELEREIDKLVYELYGLSEEEINIVENHAREG